MYELKRSERIEELVGLGSEKLPVRLNVGDIAKDFNRRYNAIISAERNMLAFKDGNDPEKVEQIMEAYGTAVINLFGLVFGDEGTEKILKFYEGDYVEMTVEVFPFIRDVIVPKIKEYAEKQRARLRQSYRGRR